MIRPAEAVVLGIVDGLTEFLPVSSTGHLILASWWLGLRGEAVKVFEVTIQAGALAAVAWLYRDRLISMARGACGQSPEERQVLARLLISFLPAAIAGLLLHTRIQAQLFSVTPVIAALAVGGVFMIVVDRWKRRSRARAGHLAAGGVGGGRASTRSAFRGCFDSNRFRSADARSGSAHAATTRTSLDQMTVADAAIIGLAQCLSLWPGTSRAMTTIVAALLLGFSATAAAEYSFLLALPTLGAATLFDALRHRDLLAQDVGWLSMGLGFLSAAVIAVIAIRGFLRYVTRHGLAPFGWYRLGVAALMWGMMGRT